MSAEWEAYKFGDLQSGNWAWAVGYKKSDIQPHSQLCTVNIHAAPNHDAEAVARLFAAAPELLEALKKMDALVKDFMDSNGMGNLVLQDYANLNEALVLTTAVLKKTEPE